MGVVTIYGNNYKFEGLEQDTNYKIKVTTKDKSNNEGKGEEFGW